MAKGKEIIRKPPGKIKASILGWLGVPVGLADPAFWAALGRGGDAAGQTVNERSVLGLSAAWSGSGLVSESIGKTASATPRFKHITKRWEHGIAILGQHGAEYATARQRVRRGV